MMQTETLEKLSKMGYYVIHSGIWTNGEFVARIYKNGNIGLFKDKKEIKLIKVN